jgi:hypothetical protein
MQIFAKLKMKPELSHTKLLTKSNLMEKKNN